MKTNEVLWNECNKDDHFYCYPLRVGYNDFCHVLFDLEGNFVSIEDGSGKRLCPMCECSEHSGPCAPEYDSRGND